MEFKISSRAKRVAFILMGMGLIGLLIGFFTEQSYITTSVNEDGSMVTFEYYDHNNGHNTQEDWDQFKLDLVAAAKAMHVEILDGGGHGHSDVDDHDHEHEGGQPLHADEDTHNNAHGGGHAEHGGHGHGPKQSWTVGAHIINTEAGLAAWHHNEDAVLSSVKELVDSHSVGLPDHQHSRDRKSVV